MNETILLWILGVLVMALASIAGLMWRHVEHCKAVHENLAEMRAELRRIQKDIGDHDQGMRGALHSHSSSIHYHGLCLWALARKVDFELPPPEPRRDR